MTQLSARIEQRTGLLRLTALAAVVIVTTVCLLPAYLFAAFAPAIQAELGLSATMFGVAVTAFFAGSSLAAMATGRLADALGSVTVLRLSLVPAALSLVLLGVARNTWTVMISMGVGGLANALAAPACSRYLSTTVSTRRLGLAFGLRQAAVPFSSLLSGFAAATLGGALGWRTVLLLCGVCALAVIGTVRAAPRRHHRVDDAGVELLTAPAPPPAGWSGGSGMRPPSLLWLACAGCIATAGAGITVSFVVITGVRAGLSDSLAAGLLVLGSFVSMVTRVELGRRTAKSVHSPLVTAAGMCLIGMFGAGLLATSRPELLIPGTLLAFIGGLGWPGLLLYAVVTAYPSRPGRASGVMEASMNLGGAAGPLVFGIALAQAGLTAAWSLAAAIFISAAGIMFTTSSRR